MNISKHESSYLKGVAILLMLFHHLFAFPNRISDEVTIIPVTQIYDIELVVAIFGKICVTMFLFLSGYGFSAVGKKKSQYYLNKIFSFYRSYWFILFIFAPIGWVFYSDTSQYHFEIITFLKNTFALSSSYNGEWWFVQIYIILVLCVPLLNALRNRPFLLITISASLLILGRLLIYMQIDTPVVSIQSILYNQCAFVLGYVLATRNENQIINRILLPLELYPTVTFLLSIVLILAVNYFVIPFMFIISTFPFIYSCLYFKRVLPNYVETCVAFLGKHSMNMWLTHSFFCYYYFQDFIYQPKHSILIFVNLIIVSLCVSIVIEKLKQILRKNYNFLHHRYKPIN